MTPKRSTPEREAVLRAVWELQEEAEISGAALARESGLGRVYLQRRLRGQVSFSLEDLAAIASPLGVTRDEILTRTGHVLDHLTDDQ